MMIYARAHDQTVADDYFAAMQRIEQRLQIAPMPIQKEDDEVVKVQEWARISELTQRLQISELCLEERLSAVAQLQALLGINRTAAIGGLAR